MQLEFHPIDCFFLQEGFVESIHFNKQGQESIQDISGPGEILGLSPLINNSHYEDDAVTMSSNSQILSLHLANAELAISGQDKINYLNWQITHLIKNEKKLRSKILILSAGELNQRLLELFEHLIKKFSVQPHGRGGNFFIPISLTKTQIAKIIDARIETAIRILRAWEREGYLEINSEGVTLKKWKTLKLKT